MPEWGLKTVKSGFYCFGLMDTSLFKAVVVIRISIVQGRKTHLVNA